jgi:hypothetical protein
MKLKYVLPAAAVVAGGALLVNEPACDKPEPPAPVVQEVTSQESVPTTLPIVTTMAIPSFSEADDLATRHLIKEVCRASRDRDIIPFYRIMSTVKQNQKFRQFADEDELRDRFRGKTEVWDSILPVRADIITTYANSEGNLIQVVRGYTRDGTIHFGSEYEFVEEGGIWKLDDIDRADVFIDSRYFPENAQDIRSSNVTTIKPKTKMWKDFAYVDKHKWIYIDGVNASYDRNGENGHTQSLLAFLEAVRNQDRELLDEVYEEDWELRERSLPWHVNPYDCMKREGGPLAFHYTVSDYVDYRDKTAEFPIEIQWGDVRERYRAVLGRQPDGWKVHYMLWD